MSEERNEGRWTLEQIGKMPVAQAEEVLGGIPLRRLLMLLFQEELRRHEDSERHDDGVLHGIAHSLRTTSDAVTRIEADMARQAEPAGFAPPPEVLAEGEFLRSQLGVGRLGTTASERRFDEAPPSGVTPGLELLAGVLTRPSARTRGRRIEPSTTKE